MNSAAVLEWAKTALLIESQAIADNAAHLDHHFIDLVQLLLACRGRVVVCGIGKTGHIGRKLAATLASTGTPAFFVSAAEAAHGDLGMVQSDDLWLGLSQSGQGQELLRLVPTLKAQGTVIAAITADANSSLAQQADCHLLLHVRQEACPLGLAPTASTTAMLALGDALAVVLMQLKHISAEDFARSHPGGQLGRRLMTVAQLMHPYAQLPRVASNTSLADAISHMSRGRLGLTLVTDASDQLLGLFTDGDLRRSLEAGHRLDQAITGCFSSQPRRIDHSALSTEALALMEQHSITSLLVNKGPEVIGLVHWHDIAAL